MKSTKTMGAIDVGTPLDLKEWELDLNVHISLKLGRVLHKSCGASRWETLKPNYGSFKITDDFSPAQSLK